jgi:hypothetical protein
VVEQHAFGWLDLPDEELVNMFLQWA